MVTGVFDSIYIFFWLRRHSSKFVQLEEVFHEQKADMDASVGLEDAKPENVKAMFEFTKEYGVY